MRRYIPVLAGFSAVLALFFAAAPSQAATASPATARHVAGPAIPRSHKGVACQTVHSSRHNRSGKICVMINQNDNPFDSNQIQALVNFTAKSGTLEKVSINHLNLWVNNVVVRSVSFKSRTFRGTKNFFSTPWWTIKSGQNAQAGVYKPCMYWTDGGRACITGHWLKGPKVQF